MVEWALRHGNAIVLFLVVALGAFLRVFQIGDESLWLDEGLALFHARRSPGELWTSLQHDVHAPPYFLALKLWIALFGSAEASVRSLSAVAGVVGIVAVFVLGRDIAGRKVGLAAAALIAVSPFHVYYSQEARQYALFFLFAVLSMHGFWRAVVRRGASAWYAYYIVATVSMLYLHFNGVFLVFGQAVYVLARALLSGVTKVEFRRLVAGWAFGLVILIPLGVLTYHQISGFGQEALFSRVPEPGAETLWATLKLFSGDDGVGLRDGLGPLTFLFAGVLLLGLWQRRAVGAIELENEAGSARSGDRAAAMMLITWAAAAVLAPFVVSMVSENVYRYKTAIPSLGAVVLLVALGTMALRPRALRWAVLLLLLALPAPVLAKQFATNTKEGWREATRFVEARARPGATIVVDTPGISQVMSYYQRRSDLKIVKVNDHVLEDLGEAVEDATDLWLIFSHQSLPPEAVLKEANRAYRGSESEGERGRDWTGKRFRRIAIVRLLR